MRAPMSWIRRYVDVPADQTGRDVAARLIAAGLEVETVDVLGAEVTGPLVVGRVLSVEELTEFKKPIRFCRVEVGAGNGEVVDGAATSERGIICGASNFVAGDLVVVALPGAVLPGGFEIATRPTYGRVSDGMITSERELALGDDHNGIMVLPVGSAAPGDSGYEVLGLGDEVLDIAVTPDRGYALSIRGIAREVATAYGLPFADPALADPESLLPAPVRGCAARLLDHGPERRRPLRAALDRRAGSAGSQPAVDAPRARRVRDAPGVPGRGRHQLRHARAGPAAARLRPGQAVRSADGPPGGAGRAAGDPGPCEAHARRRRHRDRRSERPPGPGRHDGRPRVRDRRRVALGGDRGGALLRTRRGADVATAQAVQRGLAPLRARGGPRAAGHRVGARRRAADRAGWCHLRRHLPGRCRGAGGARS